MLNMQASKEKLRLQRNEFANNISSAFLNLSSDKDFTDVTLVCEDGQQLEAHKLVLISSSPFFREASLQIPTRLIGRCPFFLGGLGDVFVKFVNAKSEGFG